MGNLFLVEGNCAVGKSTIIDNIRNNDKTKELKIYSFKQTITYKPLVPFEDSNTLTSEINFKYLNSLIPNIEKSILEYDIVFIDTFYITQFIRPGKLSKEYFKIIDDKMAKLGTKLYFIYVSKEYYIGRMLERLKHKSFMNYTIRFGSNEEQICDYFIKTQSLMLETANKLSRLKSRVFLNDKPDDLKYIVNEILKEYFSIQRPSFAS